MSIQILSARCVLQKRSLCLDPVLKTISDFFHSNAGSSGDGGGGGGGFGDLF